MFGQSRYGRFVLESNLSDVAKNSTTIVRDDDFFDPPPSQATLDYAEIALLVVLLIVGGPLNICALYRSACSNSNRRQRILAGSTCVQNSSDNGSRRRSIFEILNNVTHRTSVLLQGNAAGAAPRSGPPKPVSRLLTLKLHLTIANSMIIWLYAFSQICWLSTYQWRGGDILCRCVMFIHVFCFYATSNLVALIAIDRLYVAFYIDRPFSDSSTSRYNLSACVCSSWMLAFLCSAPQLFLWQAYEPFPDQWTGFAQCVSVWTATKYDLIHRRQSIDDVRQDLDVVEARVVLQEKVYNALHLTLVFWIPALIIVLSYALIVVRFHFNIRKKRRSSSVVRNDVARRPAVQRAVENCSNSDLNSDEPPPATLPRRRPIDHRQRRAATTGKLDRNRPNKNLPSKRRSVRTHVSTMALLVNPLQQFVCGPLVVESNAVIRLTRAKRRTAKKSFWILLAYVLCWSPYNILALWRFIDPSFECEFLEFLYNLIVLNAVVNPLIYGL